jgi:dihydroorotate dehydrogenase
MTHKLSRYDTQQTYEWNYGHAPQPAEIEAPSVPGTWDFCGLSVDSPLGIPAGPLLNGDWVLYYASLGFDVLTYKTVRSEPRACYPLPNLQPVICGQLNGNEAELPATDDMDGSWAVSFGMPSQPPDVWRADVEATRKRLPANKVLSVSVVGTVQDGWSIEQLADDYARCARWAVDSGADCVETNFSCPNVATCDGQLFQLPTQAAVVAAAVRDQIGHTPYIIKIGHVPEQDNADELLDAVHAHVDAIALTNSVATTVRDVAGKLLFAGQRRGICGDAVRSASVAQTRLFHRLIADRKSPICLIGVGGVSTADHVREYLAAGATAIQLATSAMMDPAIGIALRKQLSIKLRPASAETTELS